VNDEVADLIKNNKVWRKGYDLPKEWLRMVGEKTVKSGKWKKSGRTNKK